MKNLLNCHSKGLHSFPISLDDKGLYKRVFVADENHHLWRTCEIAIHPHHVDIEIVVLEGELGNIIFEPCKGVAYAVYYDKFKWNSHILNGNGGFERVGSDMLRQTSFKMYKPGETIYMKACELHTVFVEANKTCKWLIKEYKPSCDYFPINYSRENLTKWTPEGLYIEVGDDVKEEYLKSVKHLL